MTEGKPPRTVLIVGVDETDCHHLVDMIVKTNRRYLPSLARAKLPDFSAMSTHTLDDRRQEFYNKFEKLINRQRSLVISGSLTHKMGKGFSPLFTGEFFNKFRPDLTLILELDTRQTIEVPGYGIIKKRLETSEIRMQQELNRYYAGLLFGPIRILPIQKSNVKGTLRELKDILTGVFEE